MKSFRLNKEGKPVPSISEVSALYSNSQGYQYPTTRSMASAYGCADIDDMSDEEFSRMNVRRRNATVLARETSLGNTSQAILKQGKEQADLNRFLTQHNRWAVGDKTTFLAYQVGSPQVTLNSIGFIIAVERDIDKVLWNEWSDVPKPFLVMSFVGFMWKKTHPEDSSPWHDKFRARWTDLVHHRHLSMTEHVEFFKDNVQLSDYIGQAKDALKAGTLEIES